MLPQTLIASRGIMVVPTEPENTLANFIEKAEKNIVLIEAKEQGELVMKLDANKKILIVVALVLYLLLRIPTSRHNVV